MANKRDLYITILDGTSSESIVNLADFGKETVTFGRNPENDIRLKSGIASRYHGHFSFNGYSWYVFDDKSTNGIYWNGTHITYKQLVGEEKILIGYEKTEKEKKVVFAFSREDPKNAYHTISLAGKSSVSIGRDARSDIAVPHMAVLRNHCRIVWQNGTYYLEKASAGAQIQYNGSDMQARTPLKDADRFLIGDMQFIYMHQKLYYVRIMDGLSFEVSHLSKIVGRGKHQKSINHDINFTVNAGEFVAIVGGSGAGKSTLLKCLCGCSAISEGHVTIGGEDLASNYNSLKNLIGYVPQEDIVYDDLTLEKMLQYTARLRMPDDATEEEIAQRINSALRMVELSDRKDLLIRKLSGGQKKRASIAVELLSDPKLFFLDEPTSGLDPGIERNLMRTLKTLSQKGKTVVLVTHTPLNLNLCDKIVVMGAGGYLCFCGSPASSQRFFQVDNLVDIYDKINQNAREWAAYYNKKYRVNNASEDGDKTFPTAKGRRKSSSLRQLRVLISRYLTLQLNDSRRMLIQLLMAPGLGILLYIAFQSSYPFETAIGTQPLALTLACCAFWIGLFNAIQEICKESQIYSRERMANLKLGPYIGSKLVVNAVLDLIQTTLLLLVIRLLIGMPAEGQQFKNSVFLEIFVTTYLAMISATCLGLMVSALVSNSDQAISIAPVLLIPQILFSGVVVADMQGVVEVISYFIPCRYACVAYCTTAGLNDLPYEYKLTGLGLEAQDAVIIHSRYSFSGSVISEADSFFQSVFGSSFKATWLNPVAGGWIMLVLLSIAFIIAAAIILNRKSKIK